MYIYMCVPKEREVGSAYSTYASPSAWMSGYLSVAIR